MVPVNVFPVCMICHVIWPIMPRVMPAPIMDPLESDPLPIHVPDSDADWFVGLGPTGFLAVGDCAPQAARASRLEERNMVNRERILGSCVGAKVHVRAGSGTVRATERKAGLRKTRAQTASQPHATCRTSGSTTAAVRRTGRVGGVCDRGRGIELFGRGETHQIENEPLLQLGAPQ